MNYVTHLECSDTGDIYPAGEIHGLSTTGRPLLVRYDLQKIKQAVSKEDLKARSENLWRYREFLPVANDDNIVTLGEQFTPILPLDKVATALNAVPGALLVKDEGRLPTGSFKARGLVMAVSMAKELGITRIAMPTNGNAGAALSAYCTQANIESYIFCPSDTPAINIQETALQGGNVFRVNGLINECGKIVLDNKDSMNWFDFSTLKEPYRIEGKKTMGLELAEQLNWQLPDAIFYPTGGGTGLIGMWKAFDELEQLGWIGSKRPKMFAVQAEGCAPIVKAFEAGTKHAELWQDATTVAAGIRVPVAVGDFLILDAVRESDGAALAVSDEAIEEARVLCGHSEGVLLCPEGAATLAAYGKALKMGLINADDSSLLFNCGNGLKYPMPDSSVTIDKNDYDLSIHHAKS
ncbi:MAG: threonine synthase [Enterobacterales bacterium]|nr:threonine synthase [Enterobacterales bacterium]